MEYKFVTDFYGDDFDHYYTQLKFFGTCIAHLGLKNHEITKDMSPAVRSSYVHF